jgi:hypothetical protein
MSSERALLTVLSYEPVSELTESTFLRVFAMNFAPGRHSTGYRAFSPAALACGYNPYWYFKGISGICNLLCYFSRSLVHSTGICAGTETARCLRHRPDPTFHRPGPEPLAARGKHSFLQSAGHWQLGSARCSYCSGEKGKLIAKCRLRSSHYTPCNCCTLFCLASPKSCSQRSVHSILVRTLHASKR